LLKRFDHLSKRIYHHLHLSGYARLDYRLTPDGQIFLIEANPNPQIAQNEDFADSAAHCGVSYPDLLHKILSLGMSYTRQGC
jgi:D-alanine-D-alanine ligase